MPIGTVKFFNAEKGYGFISPETGGKDAFVHISAVEKAGMKTLKEGQSVSYELTQDQQGRLTADKLAVGGTHAMGGTHGTGDDPRG